MSAHEVELVDGPADGKRMMVPHLQSYIAVPVPPDMDELYDSRPIEATSILPPFKILRYRLAQMSDVLRASHLVVYTYVED